MITYGFLSAVSALLQSSDDGLTTNEVVQALPRDPASIFALLLVLAAAGAVLWYGRPKGGGGKPV